MAVCYHNKRYRIVCTDKLLTLPIGHLRGRRVVSFAATSRFVLLQCMTQKGAAMLTASDGWAWSSQTTSLLVNRKKTIFIYAKT